MTPLSKCHGARVVVDDGEYVCPECDQPCEVEPECALEREDAEYERLREMGHGDRL